MKKFKKIIPLLIQAAIIGIFLSFSSSSVLANEEDDSSNTIIQETPVKQVKRQSRKFDFFTLSFMGVSVGCMLLIAPLHWTFTQRREMQEKIQDLDDFLAAYCSVSIQVSMKNDNDQMIRRIRELEEKKVMSFKEYEEDKNVLLKTICDVEEEIVKLWG